MQNLINTITQVLSAAIGWVGNVVKAMFGTATQGDAIAGKLADLLPFLALGLGLGILGLGVKYVRSFVKIG